MKKTNLVLTNKEILELALAFGTPKYKAIKKALLKFRK